MKAIEPMSVNIHEDMKVRPHMKNAEACLYKMICKQKREWYS